MLNRKRSLNKDHYGYLFIAPFFLIFFIFGVYPIIKSLELSFFKFDMNIRTDEFIGSTYYIRGFGDINFLFAILRTLKLWLIQYLFEFSFAIALAAIFSYKIIRGSHFFKSAFFIPNIISTIAVSALFVLFSAYPKGMFNLILMNLNLIEEPVKFLSTRFFLQFTCIFIGWWMWYGRASIVASAGMTTIPSELFAAAKVDGATFLQSFFHITIPLVRPTLIFMVFTSAIGGMQAFEIQYMLTGGSAGGVNKSLVTVAYYIFNQAFEAGNVGYSSALTVILFVVICAIASIIYISLNRGKGD